MYLYVIKTLDGNIYVLTYCQLIKGLQDNKNYNIISTVYLNHQQLANQLAFEGKYTLIENNLDDKPKINE